MAYELKSTIHSNQFMVMVHDPDTKEFFMKEEIYDTYAKALHSAQKMAGVFTGLKYVVVAVAAVAQSSPNPIITTEYRL